MSLQSQSRLLTCHSILYQLSVSLAGGFVGAILLTKGFTLSQVLLCSALVLMTRMVMRFGALFLVRRLGYRHALMLGVVLSAMQFISLAGAESWPWLLGWILTLALAESLYWPIFHSSSAVVGDQWTARELGIRSAAGSLVNVIGPAGGGLILARYGIVTEFCIAAFVALLSITPLLRLGAIRAGPLPNIREAIRPPNYRGLIVFAADGWMSSGITIAWPILLFLSLGSRYEALGFANAGAAIAGAIAALYSGAIIHRGGRRRSARWVSLSLAAGIGLRGAAECSPVAAETANVTGAVTMGFYVPILLSVMYEGAHRSKAAYRFHFTAEAGWDLGAAGGCLIGAAIAAVSIHPSLVVLPSVLAVLVLYRTLRYVPPPQL